jgi:hypothetical protein
MGKFQKLFIQKISDISSEIMTGVNENTLMMAEAVNNMDNSLVNRFSIMSEKGY